jgi:2-epi-5-epi-valiolone synthase
MTDGSHVRHVSYQDTVEYDVVTCSNLLHPLNRALLSAGTTENACRFVVVDSNVGRIFSADIRTYFSQNRVKARIVTFPGGEQYKTVESYLAIARELDAFPIHRRNEPIIAIGGGVLTDVVGFVAGSYRRGVPHIKVPTTLMGYIDAALGVKSGLNFNGHKNRLGVFAAPLKVLLDKSFLTTLPRRHILNGVCEIIKLAVIKDADLFAMLEAYGPSSVESRFQDEVGGAILDRAICGMLEELEPNLLEKELARRMDFGHTFSYGMEACVDAALFHGEAVLLDIALSSVIARRRGLLREQETRRIFGLIAALGMTLDTAVLNPGRLWQSLQERTYHRDGLQRVPLPCGLGACTFVNDVSAKEIQAAVPSLEDWIAIRYDLL